MSKIKVPIWGFLLLCSLALFFGVISILLSVEWDSERSKRIELEAELQKRNNQLHRSWVYLSGKTGRAFSANEVQITIYPDGTYDMPHPDSMDFSFPPIDSSEVTDTIAFDSTVDTLGMKPVRKVDTIKLIYTFEVGADGKMKQINP